MFYFTGVAVATFGLGRTAYARTGRQRGQGDHDAQIVRLGRTDGRDRLDLDQLIGVTKDRHADQGARRVMRAKRARDLVPREYKIISLAARDVEGGLDHVAETRA